MLDKPVAALLILAVGLACSAPAVAQPDEDEDERLLRTDSRAPYVHRLNLRDHDGTEIDPTDEFAGPYSPRATCAKCHPYAVIANGWHFTGPDEEVPAGRPGEPWILVDAATGTQLPISYRKWPGTFTPEQVGLYEWDMVLRFGHHMPGGGWGEPGDERVQASPKAIRWGISGKLEIDCMFCHSADQQHDPAEAARQIEIENFRWSATAALGLAAIRGEARKAPDDWDPLMPPDPDFPERAGPQIIWDSRRFDPDNRVFFNTTRRPPNERCYFCHSFREVGAGAADELVAPQDVHLAAGLLCVDCHGHGIDHMMTRGYATEAAERGKPALAAFSCKGCHLGTEGVEETAVSLGGRYGAPYPQHRGLPPLHFEKLTCTTCHSGPRPEMAAKRFQTAMAHGLGLATREREDDDQPYIVGPIFARQHDGKIAPHRILSPAYWGTLDGGAIRPLPLAVVQRAFSATDTNSIRREGGNLDCSAVDRVLEFLPEDGEFSGTPVYVANRRLHRVNWEADCAPGQPGLDAYSWPLAHDVRPAAQSLGVCGCTDCHDSNAPFFYGWVLLDDPPEGRRSYRIMNSFFVRDRVFAGPFNDAWTLGFVFRPAFKWFGFMCLSLLALILLHYVLAGLDSLLRRFR